MNRYYSISRPISTGTVPANGANPISYFKNFEEREFIPQIGKKAWGFVEYNAPLSAEDISDYELIQEPYDMIGENKQAICDKLCELLQMTRCGADIVSIQLDGYKETATVKFENGAKIPVNVACDSGIAMIRDITKALR